ncbi:TonB-dependent receptor [Novosphingobium sp. UBA1939]|uniref:TonB-dependent receptor n=1 Tax=Novosphingobium sp. UBA1939 TaxID=1946982 RepID=UPI0025E0C42B|nr:TonB-dependent receptor [Novosphingobium sp. UBA1939]
MTFGKTKAASSSLAMAVAIAGMTGTAIAQEAQTATQDATGSFGDIVVTATKRSENVAKVPISITAFSGDQLKALGVTDTTQITQHVPGLQLNAWSPNVTIFNLRGISQNNFTDYLESPVAVYVDDAYMGSINGISGQLFDVQRVEVLRGPQGTLFGRNATGGLIQYVSNDASRADFNGYATGTYERFNRRTLEGAVGGSITSGLRFRVAGRVAKADGYIKPAAALPGVFESDGQALGGENGWAVRGTVQADLGPNGKLDLWYKHSQDDHVATGGYVFDNCNLQDNGYCTTDAAGLSNGTGGVINGITGEKASPYQNFSNVPGFLDRKIDVYQGKLAYDLGGIKLTSITNYTKLTKSYLEDGDATPLDLIRYETQARYSQFSEELRLSGDLPRFRWQAGFYYLDMKINGHTVTTGNPALGAAVAVGLGGSNPSIDETYRLTSKNWSLFAQTEYDLTDALTLITGLRYSKDTKGVTYHSLVSSDGSTVELASNQSFDAVIPGVDRISKGDWAARATLNFKAAANTLLFASWNRGIKGGNFTLSPAIDASTFQHKAETLNAFEGGIKWSNDSKTIRANATVFHYSYKNYQAFALIANVPQVRNSDATATGAEFEAWIRPVPHFNVNLGATWETSKVKSVATAGSEYLSVLVPGASVPQYCVDQGTGNYFCTFPAATVTNAKLPNAPRFSVNYLFRYDIDTALGNVAAQFDGAWYDGQYLEVTNGASSFQKAYNVSNASLTWTSADDRFSIEVFGRNVFNKAYRQYTLNLGPLGTTAMYAKPATYGVSASVKW